MIKNCLSSSNEVEVVFYDCSDYWFEQTQIHLMRMRPINASTNLCCILDASRTDNSEQDKTGSFLYSVESIVDAFINWKLNIGMSYFEPHQTKPHDSLGYDSRRMNRNIFIFTNISFYLNVMHFIHAAEIMPRVLIIFFVQKCTFPFFLHPKVIIQCSFLFKVIFFWAVSTHLARKLLA